MQFKSTNPVPSISDSPAQSSCYSGLQFAAELRFCN